MGIRAHSLTKKTSYEAHWAKAKMYPHYVADVALIPYAGL